MEAARAELAAGHRGSLRGARIPLALPVSRRVAELIVGHGGGPHGARPPRALSTPFLGTAELIRHWLWRAPLASASCVADGNRRRRSRTSSSGRFGRTGVILHLQRIFARGG
jgi:hypothetical protein